MHPYSIKKLKIHKIVISKYAKMQLFTDKDKNKNKIMFLFNTRLVRIFIYLLFKLEHLQW